MDTQQIATFLEVFDAGGFAPVAKRRNVAPSTVSRTVASLEAILGVTLFDRTTRRLSPTEEGEMFEARVRSLALGVEDARAELQEHRRNPSGLLRISASVSYGQAVVSKLLPAFARRYPDVRIDLLLTDRRVDIVKDRIDVALRHGRLGDSSHLANKLIDVTYKVVASPGYLKLHGVPDRPEQIAQHKVLTFALDDFRHAWLFQRGDAEEVEVPLVPTLTVSGALALRECIKGGMGLGLLPDWAIAESGLVTVLDGWKATGAHFDRSIWMVLPSRTYRPKRVSAFVGFIKAAAKS